MEGLTLAFAAVVAAAFPVAFLAARTGLRMVVRWLQGAFGCSRQTGMTSGDVCYDGARTRWWASAPDFSFQPFAF
jgi:hypothetical protein